MSDRITVLLTSLAVTLVTVTIGFTLGRYTASTQPPLIEVRDRIVVEERTMPPVTVRVTQAQRGSRSGPRIAPAQSWAATAKARAVVACESTGDPRAVSATGKYRGLWQMDADFWRTYGGHAYAPTADQASRTEQNTVAHRGYLARGWQPWSCA